MAEITKRSFDELVLKVHSYDDLDDINQACLDYCDKTMGNNSPDIEVQIPVYVVGVWTTESTHLGYVRLGYDREETIYTVQHFDLERKPLHSEWSPFDFYRGKYGYKQVEE